MKKIKGLFLAILFISSKLYALNQGITNQGAGNTEHVEGQAHTGHCALSYCFAKILSIIYKIPFYYNPFENSDIFMLHDTQQRLPYYAFAPNNTLENRLNVISIESMDEFHKNLQKDNVLFSPGLFLQIPDVPSECIIELKKDFTLKNSDILEKLMNPIPNNKITIAVHIRKGNGGIYNDGRQTSPQLFDSVSNITYVTTGINYFFDFGNYVRRTNKSIDGIKFPPEQYYVDQIVKLYNETNYSALYVEIFSDDLDPKALKQRIKNAVHKIHPVSNIDFNYTDNRNLTIKERVAIDLYSMSRFDVLIRSESTYGRIAQLIGNYKVCIYPLSGKWIGGKMIMNNIYISGSIKSLIS